MIENYRTGLVWRVMRNNPYIITGLKRAGFTGGVARHSVPMAAGRMLAARVSSSARMHERVGASTPTSIRLWAMGREGEVVAQLIPDFERENPGVRVRVQQIPWSAAHEKILTAFVGEATPGHRELGNTWVPEFVALDALEPLDRSSPRDRDRSTQSDFFPGSWSTNVVDGRAYGVPWYVDTRVLFYRTDLLKAAGYDSVPTTWAAWRDAMVRIKSRMGPRQYPMLIPTNEWPPPVVLGLQTGAPLLRDDGLLRQLLGSAISPGVRLLHRAVPRRPRPEGERHRGLEPLPGVRAREHSRCTSPARGRSASSAAGCRPRRRTRG